MARKLVASYNADVAFSSAQMKGGADDGAHVLMMHVPSVAVAKYYRECIKRRVSSKEVVMVFTAHDGMAQSMLSAALASYFTEEELENALVELLELTLLRMQSDRDAEEVLQSACRLL